jgi:hypothetical protein
MNGSKDNKHIAKKKAPPSKPVIVFFPFLCLDKPLSGGDIVLRPPTKAEIKKESKLTRTALFDLANCFRLHYEGRLPCWSFIVAHVRSKEEWIALRRKLDNLTCVLRYINFSSLREEASFSHFNYYMLEVDKRLIGAARDYKHYDCVLNGIHTVGFGKHAERVYKPYVLRHIETPFTLYADDISNNHIYQQFYGSSFLSGKDSKNFLRAFEWFNRSFLDVHEVDASHAVIHLQTALESLLKASQDGIKAQVKTALFMLLGESDELGDWIDQFWKLRNGLVHGDIDIQPFWYKHKRGSSGHRHHILIARKVFVKCVDKLFGLRSDYWADLLHKELVSNEVRLKEALTLLKAGNSLEQISGPLYGLTKDDLSASKKQVLEFGKVFFPSVIKQLKSEGKADLAQAIRKVHKSRLSKPADIALKYNEALTKFEETLYPNRSSGAAIETIEIRYDPTTSTVRTFLDFAVWRLLTFYD